MVESVPAAARSLREAGGHSRSISILGMRSNLLVLPASRLVWRVELNFARNALTCRNLDGRAQSKIFLIDRPDHLASPYSRKAGRWRHGCGLHEIHKPRFVNQTGPIELTRFEKTVNGWGFARGRSPLHVQSIITRRQRNAIVCRPRPQRPMDES